MLTNTDSKIAKNAGHHSIVNIPGAADWYIAYYRLPLTEVDGNHRELAIERLYFNQDGTIRPVVITSEGGRTTVGPAGAALSILNVILSLSGPCGLFAVPTTSH